MATENIKLLRAATDAAAYIAAVYQWVDRVEAQGGAATIAGIAECHAMLKSLRSSKERVERLIMAPLRSEIAAAEVD